ncbi:hypothetical protein FDUTEX481_09751 [Tolypothrix sp. PCC 7601]|uniref:hypothetical protein n=1 Tax=Tolypothrix sp. PCC 7712 TaxID=2596898 RepID=UPI0005EAB0D8|nr:hypothetical protein [Tolypothrix sp. PCC 7712]EKE96406.1 hypothetical protein FDUTEX481_09751 [Tolypothrix sp. PCC 7601]
MQILLIVGLQAFEFLKAVAIPKASSNDITGLPTIVQNDTSLPVIVEKDTVIVPAQKEGFKRVFLGEDCWYAILISGEMLADSNSHYDNCCLFPHLGYSN